MSNVSSKNWSLPDMLAFLAEFEAVLPEVKWVMESLERRAGLTADRVELAELHTEGYIGTTGDWRATVVAFDIENQGFPPGTRGYDGAVVHRERAVVCRMTREVAARVFKAASEAT